MVEVTARAAPLIDAACGDAIAQCAATLIGVPFRLQGRDPASGLDCVGVARHAVGAVAQPGLADFRYTMRGPGRATCLAWAAASGLHRLSDADRLQPGDIICVAPGPGQHHLMVAVRHGFIHAHYRVGSTVFWPHHHGWPLVAHWRLGAAAVGPRG